MNFFKTTPRPDDFFEQMDAYDELKVVSMLAAKGMTVAEYCHWLLFNGHEYMDAVQKAYVDVQRRARRSKLIKSFLIVLSVRILDGSFMRSK